MLKIIIVISLVFLVTGCTHRKSRRLPVCNNYCKITHANFNKQEAVNVINAYRQNHGLRKLLLVKNLSDAALQHGRDLAKYDRISHYGSDHTDPLARVRQNGYEPSLIGENVGTGQYSFTEVMEGWKASVTHNNTLLMSGVKHMGISLVKDMNTMRKTFWVLEVASP